MHFSCNMFCTRFIYLSVAFSDDEMSVREQHYCCGTWDCGNGNPTIYWSRSASSINMSLNDLHGFLKTSTSKNDSVFSFSIYFVNLVLGDLVMGI